MKTSTRLFELGVTVGVVYSLVCIYLTTDLLLHPQVVGFTVAGLAAMWLGAEVRRSRLPRPGRR